MNPKKNREFHAFTSYAKHGILREIVNEVGVLAPIPGKTIQEKDIIKVKALWDTGATASAITKSMAQNLGLKPIAETIVKQAGGEYLANVYMVNILLPNQVMVELVTVTECADAGLFGLIIGMDIICRGDFAITNVGGVTTVSFRIPSIETIDYVKEANDQKLSGLPRAERRKLTKGSTNKRK